MVAVGTFNFTGHKPMGRIAPVFFIAIVLASSFLAVFQPAPALAASAAECAQLNGKSASSILQNRTQHALMLACLDQGYCSSNSMTVTCTSTPKPANNASKLEYAKAAYAGAVYTQATALCGGSVGVPTSCAEAIVTKFNTCFDSFVKSDAYKNFNFDLGTISECTDKDNSAKILEALTTQSSSVDALTGGSSTVEGASTASTTAGSNSCGWLKPDGAGDIAMSWLMCPISGGMAQFAKWLGDRVADILFISTEDIFSKEFQKSWSSFRNLGLTLIIIAGLFMIISQAMGLEILDAYTIRKLLPRIGVALIGIALSWPLLKLALDMTNTLGLVTHDLMMSPFNSLPNNWTGLNGMLEWGFFGGAIGVGAISAVLLGISGVLALLGSIILAVLIGLLVLYVREIIIMTCIIFAPLAIAAYVLPGTQKLWSFWKNTFVTSLIMFPIIMAFLASGDALARVAAATGNASMKFTAVIVYFAPYFMLPFAFKLAGGLMTTIFSIANDKSRGLFDRSRKFRQDTKAYRKGEYAAQAKGNNSKIGRFVQSYAGRTALARQGGLGFSKADRARYEEAREKLMVDASKKKAEEGMHHVGGDTDANIIGLQATSRQEFRQLYLNRMRGNGTDKHANGTTKTDDEIIHEADEKIAKLEAGYQSTIGSTSLRRSSLHNMVTADNGAWDGVANKVGADEDEIQAAKDNVLRKVFQDGIARTDDFAILERSNKARADNQLGSFGSHVDYYNQVAGGRLTAAQLAEHRKGGNANMYKETAASGQTSANSRAVKKTAKIMSERLKVSKTGNTKAGGTYTKEDGSVVDNLLGENGADTWIAEYAAAADIHEAQMYSGQGNSEYYADVMKEKAFDRNDLAAMHPEVKKEAEKLLRAAEDAGREVTHQDVKNHLQGNIVQFSDSSGNLHTADQASPESIKKFTARKKEWTQAQIQGKGTPPPDPNAGNTP